MKILLLYVILFHHAAFIKCDQDSLRVKPKQRPIFVDVVTNVSVPLGLDAQLNCTVENLENFNVAWVREETKVLLALNQDVIKHDYRVKVTRHDDVWTLRVANVTESDKGTYLCQVNAWPMMTLVINLDVILPDREIERNELTELMMNFENNLNHTHSHNEDTSNAPEPSKASSMSIFHIFSIFIIVATILIFK